eukprot:gene13000-17430_t
MSKAEKMRGRLASMAKDREEFEKQKKELEEQMHIGRQNMGKIKKGLKNNDILEVDIQLDSSGSHHMPKSTTKKQSNQNNNLLNSSFGSGSAYGSFIASNGGSSSSNWNSSGMANTAFTNTPLMPTGPRISDWCFVGPLDSSPPVVKSKDLYENIRLLGRGSFGEVSLVKNTEDNKLFAIKSMFCAKDNTLQDGLREMKFLRIVRHPYIIDIHDAFLTANPRVLNIVMHYCESGNLSTVIAAAKKNNNSIAESQVMKWLLQLSLAIHFLHELHIIHRDLKPMNIMLTDGGDLLKLADFGLALSMDELNNKEPAGEAGTPYYTAPEMIEGKAYSYPTDCWALGIILYQLLMLERPFEGSSTANLVKAILTEEPNPLPVHFSEDLRTTVYELLNKNPEHRLTMEQMLTDPFFNPK